MNKGHHVDLFPTRLWIFEPVELAQHRQAWVEHVLKLREQNPEPAGRTTRGGWNSGIDLLNNPLFTPLEKSMSECVQIAVSQQKPKQAVSFRVQAWANVHEKGGYNVLHMHPNCLMSGCYYLSVPKNPSAIVFRDPRPGPVMTQFNGDGIHSATVQGFTPKEGQLFVFPHWLEHGVETNESDELRISIAFNALYA